MCYFAVFFSALVVDLIPVFAPPAWVAMVFLLVRYNLDPWAVLVLGVAGSTIGRYLFSLYVPQIAHRLIKRQKRHDLEFVGTRLATSLDRSWLFVFAYTLTPLSTSALFTAAALARVGPLRTLPPFFIGKMLSDALMIFTGSYMVHNLAGSLVSTKGIVFMLLGLASIGMVMFIDWRRLLEERQLHFDFKIWK